MVVSETSRALQFGRSKYFCTLAMLLMQRCCLDVRLVTRLDRVCSFEDQSGCEKLGNEKCENFKGKTRWARVSTWSCITTPPYDWRAGLINRLGGSAGLPGSPGRKEKATVLFSLSFFFLTCPSQFILGIAAIFNSWQAPSPFKHPSLVLKSRKATFV